ncbi:hypothetical protein C8R42DRAFT_21762 [Lentinula raphanica]|nr:hypothetical protein C8R42DRAFT_21762 [Lentinula raphanica]
MHASSSTICLLHLSNDSPSNHFVLSPQFSLDLLLVLYPLSCVAIAASCYSRIVCAYISLSRLVELLSLISLIRYVGYLSISLILIPIFCNDGGHYYHALTAFLSLQYYSSFRRPFAILTCSRRQLR